MNIEENRERHRMFSQIKVRADRSKDRRKKNLIDKSLQTKAIVI